MTDEIMNMLLKRKTELEIEVGRIESGMTILEIAGLISASKLTQINQLHGELERINALIHERGGALKTDGAKLPEVIAPATRENPNKEFISEAVNAYQNAEGALPGSLNVLLAFSVQHGIPGYTGVSVSGETQRGKIVSFTDTEKRTATFEAMNSRFKAEISRIKQD